VKHFLIAGMVAIVTAVSVHTAPPVHVAAPLDPAVPTAAQYNSAFSGMIHTDVAASVELPPGDFGSDVDLWIGGDTTQVAGMSVEGADGYPHSAFVEQQAGTTNFITLGGKYGFGVQQVPNWSNGDYFWASSAFVDGNELYVFGQQIQGLGDVIADAVAQFSALSLDYQGVTLLPWTDSWGAPVAGSGGFWMPGTSNVPCANATDCKTGDVAWVPLGDEMNPADWTVTAGVFPPSLNVGTAISIVPDVNGGYAAFTKEGDEYGSNSVEELTANSVLGPWTVSQIIPAPVPSGAVSYSVQLHANEGGLEAGQQLLTYAVNGPTQYYPDFVYVQE
jgi:hypothetical protein